MGLLRPLVWFTVLLSCGGVFLWAEEAPKLPDRYAEVVLNVVGMT